MKKLRMVAGLMGLIALNACKKDNTPTPVATLPAMDYINLKDTAIRFKEGFSFDLNGDGERDLFFSTLHVGDPVKQQDKQQWLVGSSFNTNLPVNGAEMVPAMLHGEGIPLADFSGYRWYNASSVILAQKITGMTGAPYWEGNWKGADHAYLPVQVTKGADKYNGWVQLSFHIVTGKVILHKAAISKEKNKLVQAGK